MMMKIVNKQTKFNKIADKRLNDITELDKKVNHDDLIQRYKGKTPDEKFNTHDNALDLISKIKNGEIKLAEVIYDHIRFKLSLGEIKKGNNKKRSKEQKKTHYTILTCFTKQETILLNFLVNILQWYLEQNIKQKMKVRDLKY